MSANAWEEVEGIFEGAAEAEPSARAAFLDAHCEGRPELRAEVESLLAAHREAGAFLEPPSGAGDLDAGAEFASTAPSIGSSIGPYRLVEVAGEGGMGKVFRAERADGEFSHQVAIKILRVPDAAGLRRFRAERQILAALQHPHIVALLDGGALPSGYAFLAMEYVRGTAITGYCRERALTLEDRLRLFHQVALAVHHAHERHVVHRDLKPSNVLVTADGTPKVVDFGIAKLLDESAAGSAPPGATISGLNPFTPDYASPEQLRGLPVTPASDVYALGVLLYEMLTGVRPYETTGKPLDEVLDLVLRQERTAPSAADVQARACPPYLLSRLRGALDRIVLRAMAAAPEARYASVRALATDVVAHLEGRSHTPGRPGAAAWAPRALAGVACAVLLLAGGGDPMDAGLAGLAPARRAPATASRAPRRGGSANPEALAAYAEGQRVWRTRTGLASAIAAYRRGISLDPGFALARVGLANAYAVQVSPSPEAEREVAEALRLAPDLGEAHAAQGFILMFHYWDWAGAEQALRRATRLAPDDALGHHWLGCCLTLVRRFDEARAELEHAARLDPESPPILLDLGLLAYYAGDDGRAEQYCGQARRFGVKFFDPAGECLVRVYERQGRYDEAWALDEWNLAGARPKTGTGRERLESATRFWLAKTARYVRGEGVAVELLNPNLAYRLATASARLGDTANALEWLDTGIGRRAFIMPFASVDPVFDSMRTDPRFLQQLSRMGLSR